MAPLTDLGGGLTGEQKRIASIIIRTGLQMGMDWRDIKIGLMAGMQESRWRNLDYGMGSSIGVFQQIDSWGTFEQRHDPVWASRQFFKALRGVDGRNQMSLNDAAQAVQRSGYPGAYRQWAGVAANAIRSFRGGHGFAGGGASFHAGPDPTFKPDPHSFDLTTVDDVLSGRDKKRSALDPREAPGLGASYEPLILPQFGGQREFHDALSKTPGFSGGGGGPVRRRLIKLLKGQLGTPYVWGQESPGAGFDCSGLVYWALGQLGYNVPRVSYQQGQGGYSIYGGRRRDLSKLKPGDLIFWDNSPRNNGADHVAFYIGNGKIIEAPRPGRSVSISGLYDLDEAWGVHLNL